MRAFLVQPLDDVASCLRHLANTRRPLGAMGVTFITVVVVWFVYVPVHELLHAAGCVIAGGTVTELQIAPQYGGTLLARWVPFVVSGGDYAGRLSGFDTKGSDLIYLATDFMPYLLTVLFGVPILRACMQRWRPVLFGVGIVVGLAPFYNLIGDYYEMGSVITTRTVTILGSNEEGQEVSDESEQLNMSADRRIAFAGIRSDDIFRLIGDVCTRPEILGLNGPAAITAAATLITVSILVGVVLALATYALGHRFASLFSGRPTTPIDEELR